MPRFAKIIKICQKIFQACVSQVLHAKYANVNLKVIIWKQKFLRYCALRKLVSTAFQRYAVRFSPTNIRVTMIKNEFEKIKKSGE